MYATCYILLTCFPVYLSINQTMIDTSSIGGCIELLVVMAIVVKSMLCACVCNLKASIIHYTVHKQTNKFTVSL